MIIMCGSRFITLFYLVHIAIAGISGEAFTIHPLNSDTRSSQVSLFHYEQLVVLALDEGFESVNRSDFIIKAGMKHPGILQILVFRIDKLVVAKEKIDLSEIS